MIGLQDYKSSLYLNPKPYKEVVVRICRVPGMGKTVTSFGLQC